MGGDTIRVEGGTQALRRALLLRVSKGDRSAVVPVPGIEQCRPRPAEWALLFHTA